MTLFTFVASHGFDAATTLNVFKSALPSVSTMTSIFTSALPSLRSALRGGFCSGFGFAVTRTGS